MPKEIFKRDYYDLRLPSLKGERETFISHYKDLSDFLQPRRGRFSLGDRNKGDRRSQRIINNKATRGLQIARSGIMAGMMSQAQPWFDFTPADPELREHRASLEWLGDLRDLLQRIFDGGNLYNMAPVMVGELLQFGTGCMTDEDDFEDVARFYTHTAGSYMIATGSRYTVDTLVREFEMTTLQMIEEFGLDKVSLTVRTAYDTSNYDAWWPVVHFIHPNKEYTPNKALSEFKRFKSCYYEPTEADKNKLLSTMGYDEFPAYCPRWDVTNEDIYGTDCPGMTMLGDVKQLQHQEKRKGQAVDKMVRPQLQGPAAARAVPISDLPGGFVAFDGDGNRKIEKLYDVNLPIQELRIDMEAVEQRINDACYVNLFRAISELPGKQPQNMFFLQQVNQERLLELGPIVGRFQGEFQDPLIQRNINRVVRHRLIRPAPPELAGRPLKINYLGPLAIAQRAVAGSTVERVLNFAGGIYKMGYTDIADKVDFDQGVDEYAIAIGAPARMIRPDESVAEIRQQRAQQAQAQAMAEGAQQVANAAKMASDAKTGEKNLLSDALSGEAGDGNG